MKLEENRNNCCGTIPFCGWWWGRGGYLPGRDPFWGVSQLVFPRHPGGERKGPRKTSPDNNKTRGWLPVWLAQGFSGERKYFHPTPGHAGTGFLIGSSSGGSKSWGPTSQKKLIDRIQKENVDGGPIRARKNGFFWPARRYIMVFRMMPVLLAARQWGSSSYFSVCAIAGTTKTSAHCQGRRGLSQMWWWVESRDDG